MAPEQSFLTLRIRKETTAVILTSVFFITIIVVSLLGKGTSFDPNSIVLTGFKNIFAMSNGDAEAGNLVTKEEEKEPEKPLTDEISPSKAWLARLLGQLVCNEGSHVKPAGESKGDQKSASKVDGLFSDLNSPPGFTITDRSLDHILACIANDKKQLVFTTFQIVEAPDITDPDNVTFGMTAFNYNWVKHLEKAGVTDYLLISLTEESCATSRSLGLTCYVNKISPFFGFREPGKGVAIDSKWEFLYKICQLGYHAIFLDNDVAVAQNPITAWDMSYDLQGLSDAKVSPEGELPALQIDVQCGVHYGLVLNPVCMSTGVMFFRANEVTVKFLETMLTKMRDDHRWEQEEFQYVIPPFLINLENRRALIFRILPLSEYHNVLVYDARTKSKNNVSTIMVHCGFLGGGESKRRELKRIGYWIPRPDAPQE